MLEGISTVSDLITAFRALCPDVKLPLVYDGKPALINKSSHFLPHDSLVASLVAHGETLHFAKTEQDFATKNQVPQPEKTNKDIEQQAQRSMSSKTTSRAKDDVQLVPTLSLPNPNQKRGIQVSSARYSRFVKDQLERKSNRPADIDTTGQPMRTPRKPKGLVLPRKSPIKRSHRRREMTQLKMKQIPFSEDEELQSVLEGVLSLSPIAKAHLENENSEKPMVGDLRNWIQHKRQMRQMEKESQSFWLKRPLQDHKLRTLISPRPVF